MCELASKLVNKVRKNKPSANCYCNSMNIASHIQLFRTAKGKH